jgi:predicted Rossmann fold flavoprotein
MNYDFKIVINWLPDFNEQQLIQKFQLLRFEIAAQKVIKKNPFAIPNRLWEYLLFSSDINPEIRWADLPSKDANRLIRNLCNCEFEISGKTTFKEEFVTAGGIKLAEIDHHTMMSKKIPNLFFAGEVMDVDGVTGGFNFQHAWTSGFIAGKAIALPS